MNDSSEPLFVYGSLLLRNNEGGIYLRENSKYLCEAKLRGRLYDLGLYPGAVAVDDEGEYVYGQLYVLNNSMESLKVLDEYEGFGEQESQPNEFIRLLQPIETSTDIVISWTYLYNLSLQEHLVIDSGDYKTYKKPNAFL